MQLHARHPNLAPGALPDLSLPLTPKVAGCWLFDEGAGGAVLDSGLFGNHGELIGGVKRAAGPALEFDGIGAHASIRHSPSLMPARITVVVRTRNLAAPAAFDTFLIKCSNSSWHDGYGLFYDSPTLLKFWVGDFAAGGVAQITVDPLAPNTFVGTYDGNAVRIFANGFSGSTMAYSGGITPNTGPLEFGRGRDNAYNINGLLSSVTILDFARAAEDALRLSSN